MIRLYKDISLIAVAMGFWIGVSEFMTGAPTTNISYYIGEYGGKTIGKITRSRILSGRWGGETYDITYIYQVGDGYYSSDQVNFQTNTTSVARKTAKQYPVDKEVTVYYDKTKPQLAVLEKTTLGWGVWGQVIAGVLMGLLTLSILPIEIIKNVIRKYF